MASANKADREAALDAAAWMFNVVTSVGVIIVNKALMATYGFSFGAKFGEMNVSLMWNSVGFYLKLLFDKIRYSRDTKLSIIVVLMGVAVCTVTEVRVNARSFIAAFIAVWSTYLQQYVFIILSCTTAVGTNLSQFICISGFTAVSFQVLGHMKTILVLVLGFIFFGKEGLNLQVIIGMVIAIVGMIWYGNASSKPGGKERWSHSFASDLPAKARQVTGIFSTW